MAKSTEKEFSVGNVVSYNDGYYRISKANRDTVNLRGVWGSKRVLHKSVSVAEVREAGNEFFESWSRSESYMCM
jgi:hypothetical protein